MSTNGGKVRAGHPRTIPTEDFYGQIGGVEVDEDHMDKERMIQNEAHVRGGGDPMTANWKSKLEFDKLLRIQQEVQRKKEKEKEKEKRDAVREMVAMKAKSDVDRKTAVANRVNKALSEPVETQNISVQASEFWNKKFEEGWDGEGWDDPMNTFVDHEWAQTKVNLSWRQKCIKRPSGFTKRMYTLADMHAWFVETLVGG